MKEVIRRCAESTVGADRHLVIEKSEKLSAMLKAANVDHECVLNARLRDGAQIVSQAGQRGR
ncbi:MAG: hypothetical protein U0797_19415 [Gemmataceae bacterium]